ncbi:Ig domain-containing protein [Terriglobus albidus]|uniref:Ig domain-containing protein n=1 Tax=Terriglobus albidus TaxID=1592106 RepID=UPI0021E0CD53|nr:Ig domain-containing protein [Terriglobus albidus]
MIVALPAPSNLIYPQTTISASVGQAITPAIPTVSGTVSSYSVSPALPAGLSLSTTTGVISGTPTSVVAQTTYTVTATNAAGSTTASLTIAVTPAAPSKLVYPRTTIQASVGQAIMPDIPTVSGTVSSYSVSPALPAGLSLNTTTGAISGTPTTVAAQTTYTVAAANAGGSTTANIKITVIQAPNFLLELGHTSSIYAIRVEGDDVLSADQDGHWALWNYTSGALLANGDDIQPNGFLVENPIDMKGQTVVDGVTNGLEIRAAADGHVLSMIAFPGLNTTIVHGPWWRLASDGSYVCIGSSTGLFIYTPSGQLAASKSGDYSLANIFPAPGQVLVALGPAGQNVIESISAVNGTSSVSPAFSGQFNSWFLDGGRFLTNLSTTVWVYSNTGVQQALVTLPTISNLTGQGNWIWTYASSTPGYPLEVYSIGSQTPSLSYSGYADTVAIASGTSIGILPYGTGQVSVIDLSGSTPQEIDYTVPIAYLSAFATSSSSRWMVGNAHGALLDGASLSSTPRYLGQGSAWSIAGTSGSVAISTSIGKISVFDPYQSTLKETINFSSGKLALSSDGTVLGASANANDHQYETDRTLNFYSLPSGNVISSFPYSLLPYSPGGPAYTALFDFSLAASGATIGRVTGTWSGSAWSYDRKVTSITGGSAIWSDSGSTIASPASYVDPVLLSPDGTLIAVYTGTSGPQSATSIFKNGTLITAVPGVAVGWIDNNRILVNQYVFANSGPPIIQYSGCTIYSSAGVPLATPSLPELKSIQIVDSDSVYDPSRNAIYSLTTGQSTWTASFPGSGVGAVSGAYVVYESGHSVVVETP